jgi:hypothetical protein
VSVLATTVGLKALATAAGELARTWNQLSQPLQAHLSDASRYRWI